MSTSTRNFILSNNGFIIIACLIGLGCFSLMGFVWFDSVRTYEEALENYHQKSHSDTLRVKDQVENVFQDIYENIRTVSKLPVVRNLDPHAGALNPADMITLQEMYNNLESHVAVTSLFILPKDFNPELASRGNEFLITFDQIIIDSTADNSKKAPTKADDLTSSYQMMAAHIAEFQKRYPTMEKISGLDIPAVSGQQDSVASEGDASLLPNFIDADRSGIIYSIPFYDTDKQLKGAISVTFLSRILRNVLPEGNYALFHSAHHRNILSNKPTDFLNKSMSWIEKEIPNPNLLYSETLPLSVQDMSGEWVLWVGLPDTKFTEDKGDVILKSRYIGCGTIVLLGTGAILILILFRRNYRLERRKLTTAKDKAENTSREKGTFVTNIIENAIDGMITIDEKGIMQTFNPAAEKIFGYTAQEAIGKNVNILMPEPHYELHDGFLKVIGTVREVKGQRKDGTSFAMYLSIIEVKTDDRRMFCGTVRDISERKKTEAHIIEAMQRLRLIFDNIGEGIYGINLKGHTTFSNKAAEAMLGYTLDDMLRKSQHELIHHHHKDGSVYPEEECPICLTCKDGTPHKVDKDVFWRKDGSSFAVDYTAAPMRDAQGTITGAVLVFRDISGSKP